jgi:hypothetical protein
LGPSYAVTPNGIDTSYKPYRSMGFESLRTR